MINQDDEYRRKLLGSLLLFTKVFYKLRTGREFIISTPTSRESHHITVCRALTKVQRGELGNLIINIPPRYGKSEMLIHFVAWCLARYPDCNFIYCSHSYSLAAKQTRTIRDIINLPEYKTLFHVELDKATTAKHDFETTSGGSVYAAGMTGSILGRGAGIKACERFGGCVIYDDAHEADEAQSDVTREKVIDRHQNTIRSRRNNGAETPIIAIAQRLHEHDICAHLQEEDYEDYATVILPGLDAANNALDPAMHTKVVLLQMKAHNPYVFYSQMQQEPQPAGGSLFKRDWFPILTDEPELLLTFITGDTAETDKTYNDATAFNLLGLYKIKQREFETDIYALHWLDCVEVWVEPADLEEVFMNFYYAAMRRDVKPKFAAIEKKSTGVTLISVLKKIQGLEIIPVEHNAASGSKMTRFINMQPFVSSGQISLPFGASHTKMCLDHCSKITANNTHSRDDICDALEMGVQLALFDQIVINRYINPRKESKNQASNLIAEKQKRVNQLRRHASWQ